MIRNLLTNWKTTSAGLLSIAGAIIHLVFAIRAGTSNENTWTITIAAVIAGLGLLAAGDASVVQPSTTEPPTTTTTPLASTTTTKV